MKAYFLAGPTASGKTAVAHYLAERHGYAILSADSMLVYRGMDIGTAKPTEEMCGGVPYFGVDLVAPSETFNVWQYRQHALDVLAECERAGRRLVVVGGTGLYLKALTHGLDKSPEADPAVREHWERVLEEQGVAPLVEALREQSPSLFDAIDDQGNGRRLVRFLEWASAGLDAPPSNWAKKEADVPMVALRVENEVLKSRIEKRVHTMYGQGLLDEVRRLLDKSAPLSKTARQAIGYAEAIALLKGDGSREEAVERTVARTRQLAKRQRTWLRTQADVMWVDVTADSTVEETAAAVDAIWSEQGPTTVVS